MGKRSTKELTQKALLNMAVPTVSMESHQVQLRQALRMASRSPKQTTKRKWSRIMTKPKYIASATSIAFALLAIVVVGVFAMQRPVSAAELTQRGLNQISRLSPSELHELDLKVNGDPKDELEAAKSAKDLKVMTYEEYIDADAQGGMKQLPGTENSDVSMKNLKYLRYTDSEGAIHTIGVDKKGLPVIIMVSKQNKDGSGQGMIRMGGEGNGPVSGSLNGPAPEGMTTCSASNNGESPTCTNSDGSSAPAPNCHKTADGGMLCSAGANSARQQ